MPLSGPFTTKTMDAVFAIFYRSVIVESCLGNGFRMGLRMERRIYDDICVAVSQPADDGMWI